MKYLLFITLFSTFLLATNITCKNKVKTTSIYEFAQSQSMTILAVQGELDDPYLYGDIDPANSPIAYYDNDSAICGGKENFNRLVEAYCDYNIDSCWDIKLGKSGFNALIKKEGKYTNNIILVNGIPCLPYKVSNVTIGFYDYDNNDIGFANFLLTDIEAESKTNLNKEEARTQREYCPNLLKYVDEWEDKLNSQNESLNKNILAIDSLNFNLDSILSDINNTLSNSDNSSDDNTNEDNYAGVPNSLIINPNITIELEDLKSEIELSIENSFSNYSNVFGFGGYGSAPYSYKVKPIR